MAFSIILVYEDRCDSELLRTTCSNLDIEFSERYYDSENIYIDKDFVEALPSIHILYRNDHLDTICIRDNVEERIEHCIEKYRIRKAKKNMGSFTKLFEFLSKLKP